ncbi:MULTISPECIES: aspartate:alanine exchanger family transporter [Myxococcaceae]|uniref:aspartate:alanine exchanger family transporter n=1 Tax=Myxococcaceae TaxID=31 RepID=UPI00188FC503|nr:MULTISPECIES: TrkA C-terminal domain-containing protein [Myxococcaceae]MBF5043106.1 hypothetical protein [Simulacricoccus sp. 17bor-14]
MPAQTVPHPPSERALRAAASLALALGVLLLLRGVAQGLPGIAETRGFLGPVFLFLNSQPFVLLFLTVAAGYALGKVPLGASKLGATAATLVVGLTASVWASLRGVDFRVPEFASTLMFNLFMFSVGMKVGPQFLSGLRRAARAFITLGLAVPLLSVGLMLAVKALFHLAPGLMPGIFAGANTATPGIGAAKDVYLARYGADSPALANLSTAFAFGYCVSLVLFVVMMKLLPRAFGRDAVSESAAYQRELEQAGTRPLPSTAEALTPSDPGVEVRVYQLQEEGLAGRALGELREHFPHVAVERVRRGGRVLEPSDSLWLERGDTVVLSGPPAAMLRAGQRVGPEVVDAALSAVGVQTVEVVASGARAIGRTVGELLRAGGHGFTVNAVFRAGAEIPFGPDTVVQRGDVFRLTGSALRVRELQRLVDGRVVRPSVSTDIVTLAVGLAVGALLGSLPIPLFGLSLKLGAAVGLLMTGIAISLLRTRNPTLGGPFPEPARQLLEDLGLNVFVAVTALNVGAGVVSAVGAGALTPILVGTVVVGLVPPVLGWVLGQSLFRLNAGLLTGAIAGARCSSASLSTAQELTQSSVPALSYPVTFALSNVLVTLACYLMASLD